MAFDAFLKIEGTAGESTEAKHKEWIEVLSFSFGVSQPSSAISAPRAGTVAEKATFSNFTIAKRLDKSSPVLMLMCASGQRIPSVTIEFQRPEGARLHISRIKMEDVLVSSVKPGGSARGADVFPMEEVSLNFSKIEWTYTPQKEDGTQDLSVRGGWDLAGNIKF